MALVIALGVTFFIAYLFAGAIVDIIREHPRAGDRQEVLALRLQLEHEENAHWWTSQDLGHALRENGRLRAEIELLADELLGANLPACQLCGDVDSVARDDVGRGTLLRCATCRYKGRDLH